MYNTYPMQACESKVFCCVYVSLKQKALLLLLYPLIRPLVIIGKGDNMTSCAVVDPLT